MTKTITEPFKTPSGISGVYYPTSHRYRIDGVEGWATGVSSLAKMLWNEQIHQVAIRRALAGEDPNAHKNKRASEGTAVHRVLNDFLTSYIAPEEPDGWVWGGLAWADETHPRVMDAERIVASRAYGYAGRFDLLAQFPDGRVGRLDFKSRGEWYEGYPAFESELWQLALYEIAARESGYEPSDFQAVIALGPDGEYSVTENWVSREQVLALCAVRDLKRHTDAGRKEWAAALKQAA